ncbi:hypothetical protein HTZ84_13620 [Haloterrigena sp. SYSU A558-1]|uniref:Uncharacterized protein n=1 Tax=Haloterrigena gelatinilytica TaxID=2741724 RepID=A0A8J8GNU7_9EURY|nr:hypothetical protein [Haloterrigena gelatinilytica]NUB90845.1 hypothetical protein [Haloterrigena gelatinilytica]NUC73337.1 hypothetical protein [Haloterrigena gelatinilytica]
MTDETDGIDDRGDDGDSVDVARARRECDVCGASVPAATYREHLLKECPGEPR